MCRDNSFKLLNLFAPLSGTHLYKTCLYASQACVIAQIAMTTKYFYDLNIIFPRNIKHVSFTCHNFLTNSTYCKTNEHRTRYTLQDFFL